MTIGPEDVRRIAELARLELDQDEAWLVPELQAILDYVALLDELDVTGVPPTSFAADRPHGWRADTERDGLDAGEALSNAPENEADHFLVPRVLDG